MKRLIGFSLVAVLVFGCAQGDEAPARLDDPQTLPVAECIALHVNALARVIERIQEFIDFTNGAPLPAGVVALSATEYEMPLDLEPDGLSDVTLLFIIQPGGSDIGDGWVPGETISVSMTFTGVVQGASVISSIAFVDASPDFVNVRGDIALNDGGTCSLSSPDYVVGWSEGDLDTASPNFVLTAMENGSTFTGQIFPDFEDDDFLAVSGELDGAPAGFLIETESFDVFED